jgi:(p)ppGpp synthase/HD superfamily hydrolase
VGQDAIEAAFPPRVAELVRILTKWWPDDAPPEVKRVGKPVYYGAIAADAEALAVKLLDRADNLCSMVHMLPRKSDWARRYHRKTAAEIDPLAEACGNAYARTQYEDALAQLGRALASLEGGSR